LGLSLQLASEGVILQLADPAPGGGCVESHVGALESKGGVVQMSQGQWPAAFEERKPGLQQQGNRIGPRHALSGDASSFGSAHGSELAGAPVRGGHRQRAACAQVACDPHELHAAEIGLPQDRLEVGEQAPRPIGVTSIQRNLDAGQDRAVVLAVKAVVRPSRDALDSMRSPSSGSSAASQTWLPLVHRSVATNRFPLLRALASRAGSRRDASASSPWYSMSNPFRQPGYYHPMSYYGTPPGSLYGDRARRRVMQFIRLVFGEALSRSCPYADRLH
jgi:hypothetical protein